MNKKADFSKASLAITGDRKPKDKGALSHSRTFAPTPVKAEPKFVKHGYEVRVDVQAKLKMIATFERRKLKEVVNDAFLAYIQSVKAKNPDLPDNFFDD